MAINQVLDLYESKLHRFGMVFRTNCTYKGFTVTRLKCLSFLASSKVTIKVIPLNNSLLGKMHVLFIHEFKILQKLHKTRYSHLVLPPNTHTFTITSSIILLNPVCKSIWYWFLPKQRKYKEAVVLYTAVDHNNRHQRQAILNLHQRLYLIIGIKENSG